MRILKSQEVEAKPAEGARGVTIRHIYNEEYRNITHFDMRLFEIEPGASTPLHDHAWSHEILILQGSGAVVSEGQESSLEAGDLVFIPPRERHSIRNLSDQILKFLCLDCTLV